ncbi:SMC5-SMC6 complex localization factor protein 1 [Gastrophryne carolinensis]
MELPGKERIVQLTGFRNAEKEGLARMLQKLPGVFLDCEKFQQCTHLIAKKPCNSEKWLAACASGKWVLTKEYVINSAESGRWLDETTYEWGYKIERDAHYSPQMQSAPKRWREHLTRTRALGAFSRWKVALLIEDADKEREAFLRVLTAGQATLWESENPDGDLTHVFTNTEDKEGRIYNAPYYSVLYLGTYLLEGPGEDMTGEQIAELKTSIWKRCCMAQVKRIDFGRSSLHRIEELIEGQFFAEAFVEIEHLLPSVFPQKIYIILLKHFIQGNIDNCHFGRFYDVFCNLLYYHPPWESVHMSQFYLRILQCPICRKGTWTFLETLSRCFLDDLFCLCHKTSDLEMDLSKMKKIVATVLKFVMNVMQEEVKSLGAKLSGHTDVHKALFPSFIVGVFWPETRIMVFLTKPVSVLTDLVILSYKMAFCSDSVLKEIAAYLSGMLAATVDYWILLGFYLNKKLLHQISSDYVYYIFISCEEFTVEMKKQIVSSISSSWLQMLVAEVIFKNLYMAKREKSSCEPITLGNLIHTYIPALWEAEASGSEKVQKVIRKMKIGQRPCLESQKALLMLNGENKNQGDVLLDLPLIVDQAPNIWVHLLQPGTIQRETVLHRACKTNNVKKLTTHLRLPGVDINVKDNAGWTPLHEACNHGSTECVREILQQCPEVDLLIHVNGVTPLHDALQNGHVEIGKMLLRHAGPVVLQQRDCDGNFPLDYVSSPKLKKEFFEIVQVKETIEEFHTKATLESERHQLDFGAFLLTRMLINFLSVYGLPSDLATAKMVCPNATVLVKCARNTPSSFSNSIVECCIEAVATMHGVREFLQSVPEFVLQNPKFNTQCLFTILVLINDCYKTDLLHFLSVLVVILANVSLPESCCLQLYTMLYKKQTVYTQNTAAMVAAEIFKNDPTAQTTLHLVVA